MAGITFDSGLSPRGWRWPTAGVAGLALCLALMAVLPGCGGCRKTPQQRQAEREKKEAERRARERERQKKQKPDLELGTLCSLPHEPKPESCPYKPGHWTAATLPAKANNFDLVGELEMTVVDRRGRPIGLPGMGYTSAGARQVALPKGQPKWLQSVIYVPPTGQEAFVASRVNARTGRRGVFAKVHELDRMPAYQYHFVVLARWPTNLNYKYIAGPDSVKHPSDLSMGGAKLGYYRLQLLRADKQPALPFHGLFWTSIAHILWDDADPDALRIEQQVALLDWLHWGGGLIISGPDSLDALGNSFLGPYLPATSAGTRELGQPDFQELSARFTLPVHGKPGRQLHPVGPCSGVKFDVHPRARLVPHTGGLLVERRVGRGRIVVSAFELDHPELTKWPGFDGFFNACLLGRPPRKFVANDFEVRMRWADGRYHPFDPRVISKLRYFTRDTGKKLTISPQEDDLRYGGEFGTLGFGEEQSRRDYGPDVASWSDFNSVANSARESLQNAARIEIPQRTFVVWVVGVYLLILVPANWLAVRLVGRVEWAWAAAPVIAIVYTLVVIRLAQLDIGFARSLTEIAVVEMQGDYPRAHVTRYTALYTSLAAGYGFRFEDRGAQVQPFPAVSVPEGFRLLPGQGLTRLQYRYVGDVTMRGFHVTSNTTGLVHGEQMTDVGGPILLADAPGGGYQLTNQTAFTLHEAGVIRRNESGDLETAWIGTLTPEQVAIVRFRPLPDTVPSEGQGHDAPNLHVGPLWAKERDRSGLTAPGAAKGQLNFRQLVELAEDPEELGPGDVKLIGWLDDEIPGLEVKPQSAQSRRAALVVARLRFGFGEDPQPDVNTRQEIQRDDYRTVGPDTSQADTE